MLKEFQDAVGSEVPKEGDIYRELSIGKKTFVIPYGYYEDFERHSRYNDPIPIYPDFINEPQYTDQGEPFATAMQDTCSYFTGRETQQEESCLDCFYFLQCEDLIGICRRPERQKLPETEA